MTYDPPKGRPRPSVQEVLASDVRPAPDILRFESPPGAGDTSDIPIERYFSREWHDKEVEKVWKKVWQMACRAEDIPNVGDHIVYEIADESIIVARTASGVKAFVNACLHRGVLLRKAGGCVKAFRCPFHGFTWTLEGELSHVPSAWDFEHINRDEWSLPQVHVGEWGGFVFVNLNENPEPLESYLEILPEHFKGFELENRYKAVHIAKILPCNWKLALEAFIESFHIPVAHPQTTGYVAWDTSQYDIFPGVRHVNRMLTLEAVPSTAAGDVPPAETIRQMQRDVAFHAGPAEIEPDQTIRQAFAERTRRKLTRSSGKDLSQASDTEMLDVIQYMLFPNMVPWGGHGVPICYRFRPFENDPERSIMEIMLLFAKADDGSHPEPGPITWLGIDDKWESVPGLGSAGMVADQDTENLRRIQKGLKATRKRGVTLAQYQESRIRHFHETLDMYMEMGE